jgi:hypothetical protein
LSFAACCNSHRRCCCLASASSRRPSRLRAWRGRSIKRHNRRRKSLPLSSSQQRLAGCCLRQARWVKAGPIPGIPSVVGSVILGTDFGKVWLWRLGAVVVLLAVLTFTRGDRWVVVAILATFALGSLGLVGHAVMRSGTFGWLTRLSFVAHVLAAGFWLGSLAPLIASLRLEAGALSCLDVYGHPIIAVGA